MTRIREEEEALNSCLIGRPPETIITVLMLSTGVSRLSLSCASETVQLHLAVPSLLSVQFYIFTNFYTGCNASSLWDRYTTWHDIDLRQTGRKDSDHSRHSVTDGQLMKTPTPTHLQDSNTHLSLTHTQYTTPLLYLTCYKLQSTVQLLITCDDPAVIDQIFVENHDFCRAMLCRCGLSRYVMSVIFISFWSAALAVMLCLCVRLSRLCIVSKRINISSKFFTIRYPHNCSFSIPNIMAILQREPPASNAGWVR